MNYTWTDKANVVGLTPSWMPLSTCTPKSEVLMLQLIDIRLLFSGLESLCDSEQM